MKITDELREAAEKYQNDWLDRRFAYSKDYTPESAFIAGAQWAYERGRMEERERILKLLESDEAISKSESLYNELADWLESKLGEADAKEKE